jgi:hypothetical protein
MKGNLDEIRVSNSARSVQWIATEYNNQNLPSAFAVLGGEEDGSTPVLAEVTPVTTPATDATPAYVFSSTHAGTITYGGDCASSTTDAVAGANTITFNTLAEGTHSNCTLRVTNIAGHASNTLALTPFLVDLTAPPAPILSSPLSGTTVAERRPAFSWNAVTDSGSGIAKYQLYIDGVMEADNITDTSQAVSAELACGAHTWSVKAYDNVGYTADSATQNFTISCGGGFTAPARPNITKIKIDNIGGKLDITDLPASIVQIAVSATSDFQGVSWQDIGKMRELLNKLADRAKLYLKFRSKEGGVSDVLVYENKTSWVTLDEGDIVKAADNFDVYIIKYKGDKQYKRLILSPSVFRSYRHLRWENIQVIAQAQLDSFTTSNLVQVASDKNVYELFPEGDTGRRKVFDTSKPHDADSVYEINAVDRDSYGLVR